MGSQNDDGFEALLSLGMTISRKRSEGEPLADNKLNEDVFFLVHR